MLLDPRMKSWARDPVLERTRKVSSFLTVGRAPGPGASGGLQRRLLEQLVISRCIWAWAMQELKPGVYFLMLTYYSYSFCLSVSVA